MLFMKHMPRLRTLAVVPILAGLCACSLMRGWEAALVLSDIAAADKPSYLKRHTPAPSYIPISYSVEKRAHEGDLYLPGEEVLAGIVLIPGAHPAGRDDPRIINLATSLARANFAVLVPEMPSLRELKVSAVNIGEVADAFAYMASRPEISPHGRAGMAAFSYAVGPVALAALDEDIHDKVRFIFGMGGYYDLSNVIRYFTTGYYRENGVWEYMEPNRYGMWVFLLSNIGLLSEATDRKVFEEMVRRKLGDVDAPIDDLIPHLGAEGRALHDLISNTEREHTPELIARLPQAMRDLISSLTLADKDLSRLQARLILVHSRRDAVIPYMESITLARSMPEKQARLYLIGGETHVDMKALSLLDRFKLWRAIDALLAERKR